jgi:hypothetical protein
LSAVLDAAPLLLSEEDSADLELLPEFAAASDELEADFPASDWPALPDLAASLELELPEAGVLALLEELPDAGVELLLPEPAAGVLEELDPDAGVLELSDFDLSVLSEPPVTGEDELVAAGVGCAGVLAAALGVGLALPRRPRSPCEPDAGVL